MGEYFYGENVVYNKDALKEELNKKGIYLESYEIDDKIKLFNLIYGNDLDNLRIDYTPLKNKKKNGIMLRGICDTEVSKAAYDHLIDIIRIIKLNLLASGVKLPVHNSDTPKNLVDMLNYIENNVILIKYPVNEEDSNFHSFYLFDEYIDRPVIFINTNEYQDNQYFYLAHELYHHFNKDYNESLADEYAAKLLIPDLLLEKFDVDNPLRNIVALQDILRVPYKAIVKALYNRNYIALELYNRLMRVNPRERQGEYYELIKDNFDRYNVKTLENKIPEDIKDIITKNYTDGIINYYEFNNYLEVIYEVGNNTTEHAVKSMCLDLTMH